MADEASNPTDTVTLRPGDDVGGPSRTARLHVVHPPDLARAIHLGDALVIGRGADGAPGRLSHETVSRDHVRLHWDGRMGAHAITELGSHNGSWLDGGRLAGVPVVLHDGAVVRLGGVVLVYELATGDDLTAGDALVAQIPGGSREIRRLRAQIAHAAPDPAPALIAGETGTGKEHVARALHDRGRRTGPFVAVNVSELTPQLVESQLFGHTRGAFTGADRSNEGLFVAANGGTLFLDEIGELPTELQPKLLRALQEREVRPVGATRAQRVDVRIVAATNRALGSEIASGRFRRDLYARLAMWELAVPALRERRCDVMGWIDQMRSRWAQERGLRAPPAQWTAEAVEVLVSSPWPENLRGIDRLVHQMAHVTGPIAASAVRAALGVDEPDDETEETETLTKRAAPESREELVAALEKFEGSVRAVAKWYGRDRRQVYRWMDTFGIDREAP